MQGSFAPAKQKLPHLSRSSTPPCLRKKAWCSDHAQNARSGQQTKGVLPCANPPLWLTWLHRICETVNREERERTASVIVSWLLGTAFRVICNYHSAQLARQRRGRGTIEDNKRSTVSPHSQHWLARSLTTVKYWKRVKEFLRVAGFSSRTFRLRLQLQNDPCKFFSQGSNVLWWVGVLFTIS